MSRHAVGCTVFLWALSLLVSGCGSRKETALSPPVYEHPTLPEWTPPASESEEDPTLNLSEMEGQWVTDSEEEDGEVETEATDTEGPQGPPDGPENGNGVDPNPGVDEAPQRPAPSGEASELPESSHSGENGGK